MIKILHYDFTKAENFDLTAKIVKDLSGSGNDGELNISNATWNSSYGKEMLGENYIKVPRDLFIPKNSYRIRCVYRRMKGGSDYGTNSVLFNNRKSNGLYNYFPYYPTSGSCNLWDYGPSGLKNSMELSIPFDNRQPSADFDITCTIDSVNGTGTIEESTRKLSSTNAFKNTLNGDLGYTELFKVSGTTFWLKSFEIYTNNNSPNLFMDENSDLYTINGVGNLEIVSNMGIVTRDIFLRYGRDMTELKKALTKWNKDKFKIVSMKIK